MKSLHIIRYAAVAAAALALAACSTATAQHPAASHPAAHTAAPSSPSAAQAVKAVAAANDKAFAEGEAASVIDAHALRATVAGPVMTPYAEVQSLFTQAFAASGSPAPAEAVTAIPGGFNLCGDNGNGGTACNAYTAFRHNAAGRIVGVSVNGQPVAGRLATGSDNHGPALTITHVIAYRPAGGNQVWVAFNVKNTGSAEYTDSPPFLGQFNPTGGGTYSEDDTSGSTVYPQSLQPGASAVMIEAFDTTKVTGTFSLRTNNGYESLLASTTLSNVAR